jgi:Peptidase S24-like
MEIDFNSLLTELLEAKQTVRLVAPGQSMLPLIQNGATLTVQPVLPKKLKRGQIVVGYTGDGRVLIHRLIRHAPVLTRGDHCPLPDQTGFRVVGVVRQVEQTNGSADFQHFFWSILNPVIGYSSAWQIKTAANYAKSPSWGRLLQRKTATALYLVTLKLGRLGFRPKSKNYVS